MTAPTESELHEAAARYSQPIASTQSLLTLLPARGRRSIAVACIVCGVLHRRRKYCEICAKKQENQDKRKRRKERELIDPEYAEKRRQQRRRQHLNRVSNGYYERREERRKQNGYSQRKNKRASLRVQARALADPAFREQLKQQQRASYLSLHPDAGRCRICEEPVSGQGRRFCSPVCRAIGISLHLLKQKSSSSKPRARKIPVPCIVCGVLHQRTKFCEDCARARKAQQKRKHTVCVICSSPLGYHRQKTCSEECAKQQGRLMRQRPEALEKRRERQHTEKGRACARARARRRSIKLRAALKLVESLGLDVSEEGDATS